MRIPSLLSLLGALQQYGLTAAHLALVLTLCRARHTGPVVLHLASGRILKAEGLTSLKTQWRRCHAQDAAEEDTPWS